MVKIHNPNYVWKGIPLDAYAWVTSFTSVPNEDTTYQVSANVNKYTNETGEYDIEQTTEIFANVTEENLYADYLTSELPNRETFSGWVIA